MDIYQESIQLHEKLGGKLSINSKLPLMTMQELSRVYTPGVAEVCREIHKNPSRVKDLTMKKDTVAIVTDGSAVLGLGNIGPEAALPVMEGKAMIFKEFAGINAVPICLQTQNTFEIINIIKNISTGFAGINLEDISAPRCFKVEEALQDLGIPVFHDDQHGTAIVLLAALINAAKLAKKDLNELKVVINGAGAAGTAIAELLLCIGYSKNVCHPVKELLVCDSKGIISRVRQDIMTNEYKKHLVKITNRHNVEGTLEQAIKGADVFVGVSVGNVLTKAMVQSMNDKPIIFAMANPTPEINPKDAEEAGAFIVGTGRSDYLNQVNNALVFPGIFKGALEANAEQITHTMKIAAAYALARSVKDVTRQKILPSLLEKQVVTNVALAVKQAYEN